MRVIETGKKNGEDGSVAEISALGQALADPIRVKMLGMMADGRECCELPECGAPATAEEMKLGICVCEFMGYFGMSQSKTSYHLGKLKAAGMVEEKRRGKWRFYNLRGEAVREALRTLARHLGSV